ncbi:NAD(P)-binding domain-containing protein [Luteibacter rhizovicinus]|uniref:NAD(P)-binding domain-containing protein n=1 Tax=Luteibacter rhizovicinus TaxID=242606 RepID=UPI000B2AE3BC|nr:NAD(P)-binding domain-containing protein [Luteibacter rhizovicinus]
MSTISIIGSGGMATAIATLAVKAGHTVEVITRDPAKASALAGKLLVDITNPVAPDLTRFVTPGNSSGAQEIAKAAPPSSKASDCVHWTSGNCQWRGRWSTSVFCRWASWPTRSSTPASRSASVFSSE